MYRDCQERDESQLFVEPFTHRSPEEWRWLYRRGPHGAADIGIVTSGGTVAGCIIHVPAEAWVEGRQRRLAVGCNMVVLPEFRGRGGGSLLARGFHTSDHGFDMNFGTVNGASSHITGSRMGTVTMGRIPEWRRFAVRGRHQGRIVSGLLSAAERVYGFMFSLPRPSGKVVDLPHPGDDADHLAAESAAFAPCIRVRDAGYLTWRWLDWPDQDWRIRGVRGVDGGLQGFIVYGVSKDGGGRIGVIADLLARDYTTTRTLLADAWTSLVERGCDRVLCAYRDPRPWSRKALRRSGFRPFDGLTVACGPLSPEVSEVVTEIDSWYVTFGDVIL